MPGEWNCAIIFRTYKKGNKVQCSNYQGILLLNVTYKIFTHLVAKNLEPHVEEVLHDNVVFVEGDLQQIRFAV
jgi:hypothetical protein